GSSPWLCSPSEGLERDGVERARRRRAAPGPDPQLAAAHAARLRRAVEAADGALVRGPHEQRLDRGDLRACHGAVEAQQRAAEDELVDEAAELGGRSEERR